METLVLDNQRMEEVDRDALMLHTGKASKREEGKEGPKE